MPTLPAFDVKTNINKSPHVVILGAGASRAAFPNGEASGKKIPLMNDIMDMIGLKDIIESEGINADYSNFEALYDDLVTKNANSEAVRMIEQKVYDYFSSMSLPPKPTLYDYLILSLRKKDIIASFNWDPFLAQAFRRNMHIVEPPRIVFLHGNVEIGVCIEHRRKGYVSQRCEVCQKQLTKTKLLYPVKHKDYNSDPFILNEWEELRLQLNHAYMLTVFGYSAPNTDVEAKKLMLEVWKTNSTFELAEVDIIDKKKRDDLGKTWAEFYHGNHYGTYKNIFRTLLFRFPRRSCEALAMATLQNHPWHDNPFPRFKTLDKLHRWLQPLINEEKEGKFSRAA
ncbi:MAG: hypothetical protein Q8K51_02755 [Nitrospirota bacterium]|nr:hypothetical protein [Nitrospirota bacterium]